MNKEIKIIAESARKNTLKAIKRSKLTDKSSKMKLIPSTDEIVRKASSISKTTSLNKLEKTLAESILNDLDLTKKEFNDLIKLYG
ncbi:MAG: hypothetical protein CI948_2358 [Halanaerobium sp.]|jgi:hypothetical protein|nr:hypothetical protein [Halanaerobium congolense]PUU88266.1 MAG: hypothetical protein CI948_2358 [Halanaerobium sp.]